MKREIIYQGRWLASGEIQGRSPSGKPVSWEFVTRQRALGSACIAAIRRGPPATILLVKQWRAPLDAWILEFPAGLIDQGSTAGETALRELQEETGATGSIVSLGPPIYNSPGITDESTQLVLLDVKGENSAPQHEPDEEIQLVELPLEKLRDQLTALNAEGLHIDAKLWCFATGAAGV